MTRGGRRRGQRDETGAFVVLWVLMLGALAGMAALAIDLGQLRAGAGIDQSVADLAALAAGPKLSASPPDYLGACEDAIAYLVANANAPQIAALDAADFCTQAGNDVRDTTCSGGPLAEATPSVTLPPYTVSLHFPVPNAEIADPNFGAGMNDGTPCERLRVIVTTAEPAFFGAVAGYRGASVTRSATVRAVPSASAAAPALWLLDPFGCTSLAASGGSNLTIGSSAVAGYVSVDSDGTACSSNQFTITASGSGTFVHAMNSTTADATIALEALPPGATSCVAPACSAADVTGGRLAPQPTAQASRSTRALVDNRYDCGTRTIDYFGLVLDERCTALPPYIDNLVAAVGGSGLPPGGFQQWSKSYSCSPSGAVTAVGNWWVDCPGGLKISAGTTVDFPNGNVVFDAGISMSGGLLEVNTAGNPSLPADCLPPEVATFTSCAGASSENAAFVYLRNGDISTTGGQLLLDHVLVYQAAGALKFTGNSAPPTWLAPGEGPFAGLALWSEETSTYTITGGAAIKLDGVFFTPGASPLKLTGGGNWGQLNAQLISRQLQVSGGGVLDMTPDPTKSITLPAISGELIR